VVTVLEDSGGFEEVVVIAATDFRAAEPLKLSMAPVIPNAVAILRPTSPGTKLVKNK